MLLQVVGFLELVTFLYPSFHFSPVDLLFIFIVLLLPKQINLMLSDIWHFCQDFAKTIEILLSTNLEEHCVGLGSHVKLVFSRWLEIKEPSTVPSRLRNIKGICRKNLSIFFNTLKTYWRERGWEYLKTLMRKVRKVRTEHVLEESVLFCLLLQGWARATN